MFDHLLDQVGNPSLMTAGLKHTLVAHTGGNSRAFGIMTDGLLAAAERNRQELGEKHFIETWSEHT